MCLSRFPERGVNGQRRSLSGFQEPGLNSGSPLFQSFSATLLSKRLMYFEEG